MGTVGPQRIIVGVNASRVAQQAVLWAAQEARVRRLDLIIAHVTPSDASPSPDTAVDRENLLNSCASAASRREPSVVVGTLLLRGMISEELARLTKSAVLLVVGVDSVKPRSAYGALGSVEDRLLVNASCPVVTVSQSARFRYERRHRVVAVWTGGPTSENVLTHACAEAALSAAELTVAIAPESAPSPGQVSSAHHDHLRTEALVRSAARAKGVQVDVAHLDGQLAPNLSQMSAEADLVMMGCEHSNDKWSIRTGSLAGMVMRTTSCPVMFINSATT